MADYCVDALSGRGAFSRKEAAPSPSVLFMTYDMVPLEFWEPGLAEVRPPTAPATPVLDELARHTVFTQAWATSPLCAPSRAAFLTGRHSYITTNSERAHDGHEHALRASDSIFPEYLKAAGWRTRHVGKCHVGASTFIRSFGENDRPWDRWSPPWYDDEDYAAHLRSFGLDGFQFKKKITFKAPAGGPGNSTGGWVEGDAGQDFPEAATYAAFTATRAIRSLEDLAARGQPFYLQVDFFEPHQPFMIPAGLEARERELRALLHLPESWKRLRDSGFADPGSGSLPRVYSQYRKYWGLQEESAVLDYLVAHILQFEVLERQSARIVARMKELGLWDGTLVVLCADHGEMNTEEGLVDKGAYLHPRVTRVPLFLKQPYSKVGAGRLCDSPVSLLDIAPTILEAAGIGIAAPLDGVSLKSTLAGSTRPTEKPILFEVWSHVVPNPCVGSIFQIEGKDCAYVFNAADPVDEFRVRREDGSWDPQNRIADPAYAKEIAACRAGFLQRLAADRRWVSWEAFFRLRHAENLGKQPEDLQKFVE